MEGRMVEAEKRREVRLQEIVRKAQEEDAKVIILYIDLLYCTRWVLQKLELGILFWRYGSHMLLEHSGSHMLLEHSWTE